MRTTLSTLVFCLLAVFCKAQEVPETQKTIITKITATWCPNCGSWGWDFFDDLIDANTLENAVFISAHHSGTLDSDAGAWFSSNFMAPYQPYFYAGNQDLNVTSGNVASKVTETRDLIETNAGEAPIANVGFEASLTGNSLSVNTNVKFFQEAEGEYYLGLYILEDKVIAAQSSNSNTASHHFVMRSAITDENFGVEIANGMVSVGTEITGQFDFELSDEWDVTNVSLMGVIWKKEGATYQFVNVNAIDEFSTVSVQTLSEEVAKLTLTPTLTSQQTQLNIELQQQDLEVIINLYNLQGQLVQTIFEGQLNRGTQSIDISTSTLSNGNYFVNLSTMDGRQLTKAFIVQK